MPCFHPLKGYRGRIPGPSGRLPIVFDRALAYLDLPVTLPCGQCDGCRLEHSRQWAIRCSHEASLYQRNAFITLTYDDANLPATGSLDKSHFQKFMKRLRKKHGPNIRYYQCGEYGEKLGRPHYHACLFNFDFDDKTLWKIENKQRLYRSAELERLWPFGFSLIGSVTFESAAYVARYIMKKINGQQAKTHYKSIYEHIDPTTGEIFNIEIDLLPEYTTMSRRPHGIGYGWLQKFKSDVYPSDFLIVNGKKMKPPKFYDRQYELTEPKNYARVRARRVKNALKHADNNTPARLKTRETVHKAKMKLLPRNLD